MPRPIERMNIRELTQYWTEIRAEIHRIDSLKGNTNDMDWAEMDQLAVEMGRVLDAINVLEQVTYGYAIEAKAWENQMAKKFGIDW